MKGIGNRESGTLKKKGNRMERLSNSPIPDARFPIPALLRLSPRHRVLHPRERENEEGREHVAEQEIHPDQRRVKGAKAESHPQRAQWSMCLHFRLLRKSCRSKLLRRQERW